MKIKVTAFKDTGKCYSDNITEIEIDETDLFTLPRLIKEGFFAELSPIQGGFMPGYYYQIEAIETTGWFNHLIDKTK